MIVVPRESVLLELSVVTCCAAATDSYSLMHRVM
jgi:hypothetical protein